MVAIKKPKTPHRPMASFVSIIFSQKKNCAWQKKLYEIHSIGVSFFISNTLNEAWPPNSKSSIVMVDEPEIHEWQMDK